MEQDHRLFLLVGDTGFNLVEPLFEAFPDRTLNVGVAEQNLVGISAGLCNAGFRPVCYAITNFLVHRCFEQTRNDLCLHNYPVILAGTGAGFDNGSLGPTHHIIDDIGCLKAFPNLQIYSPSSVESMDAIFNEVAALTGPAYIRIAKGNFSNGGLPGVNRFVLDAGASGPLLISHSKMVKNCLAAAKGLPGVSVFAMDRIKPIQEDVLETLLTSHKQIVVVEDNFKSGLYNTICQFAADKNLRGCRLHFIGPAEEYETRAGDSDYLEAKHGLSPDKIQQVVANLK